MHAKANNRISETRDDILDVALKHFRHFGVVKTAMADIANDVKMSTANLYRYFKNKEEIVVACSQRCLSDRHKHLLTVVNNPETDAEWKLHEFFRESLKYTYNQSDSNPNITELVNVITSKHHQIVHEKNITEQSMIKNILEQGQEQQIFNIDNLDQVVKGIHASLHLFQFPVAMNIYTLKELEEKAESVTSLLLKGLKK